MSNSITTTRVNFSGKMALIAAVIVAFAISTQVKANELTQSEQAAVQQHFEILDHHQQASEAQIIDDIQANLDQQMEQAETQFMETTCAEHDRQYDSETQVCYE